MSFLITTDGKYLGEIRDQKDTILVVFPDFQFDKFRNEIVLLEKNKVNYFLKELATPLAGQSEKFPGYQKPIALSESTWRKIEKSGGKRPIPFVINNSSTKAFIKPESKVFHGPGRILDHKIPIPLEPGQCIYGCIDGLNTLQRGAQVYKVVDGVKVAILADGEVKITSYNNLLSRLGQWRKGGWKDRRKGSSWVALSKAFDKEKEA